MHDPRDPVDTWLHDEIQPLAPRPGTFEQIQRRARHRKTSRALTAAAGVAVVAAAAVAAPGIASTLTAHTSGPGRPAASGTRASLVRPGKGSGTASSQSSSAVQPPASSLSAAGSGTPVPANFQPTSVTFVGPHIGAVIGQAGTNGHCATNYCTSLAGTSDYGASWYGVNAPVTGAPDGSAGVGQIRFLNIRDGWAFGPALWVTHDGGASWTQENTFGQRVTDLETAGNRAFALLGSCSGTGQDYAADCTSLSLYSSPASGDQWSQVPGPTSSMSQQPAGSQPSSAGLVLTGSRGYLLAPSGELLSGPLTGAAWTAASPRAPCQPGPPSPAGQPAGALLAADSAGLVLVCANVGPVVVPATSTQVKSVFESSDGGLNWSAAGTPPAAGIAMSLAAQPAGLLLLATDAGIYRSGNGGSTWQQAQASPAGAAITEPGFSYVGMTSLSNGVALPADPGLHEVFITSNGGSSWQPQPVSAP